MSTLKVENLTGITSGANANKIIVPSGQTLDASNGSVNASGGLTTPAGHVIQFLSQETTLYQGIGSTSLVASPFTLTITPKFNTSKIKIMCGMNGFYMNTTAAGANIRLYKNGADHLALDNISGYAHSSGQAHQASSPTWLTVDSPATTSAVTYAIYWAVYGSGNMYMNNYLIGNNRTRSWYTLEEIAG